jgi:septum formation protein
VRLILASASPRRAELLRAAGFEFEIVAANVDESIRAGESPQMYVRRLAAAKSAAALAALKARCEIKLATTEDTEDTEENTRVSSASSVSSVVESSSLLAGRPADVIVLGADTAVVVDGDILGKPRDDEEAAAMLRRLSGRRHDVMTGVSLRRGAYEVGRVETTAVIFTALSDEEVRWYVASREGRDKAGAYAIQGLASRFIPRIEGSYSNVVGLPVACVAELLREISSTRPVHSSLNRSDRD